MVEESIKYRVLIVDNDLINMQLLEAILTETYEIKTATSGKTAIAMASEINKPDLILLDIMLPDMDGYEVCRCLKATDTTRDIPVIFLTALDSDVNEALGFKAGCVDYLRKPPRFYTVTARIDAHIALAKSKQDLQATNRAMSSFISTISHEIRTPMNAIIGMTDIISRTALTAEQQDYLTSIKQSADTLLLMLNNILDHARMKAGKLKLSHTQFNLRVTLEHTCKIFSSIAIHKGLEVVCDISEEVPIKLIGDPNRLRQIVLNLVFNAIKFSEHGQIQLRVWLAKENNHNSIHDTQRQNARILIHFCVSDTGIGIPDDKQKTIFEPFIQQDNSHTRKFGGSGLGLTICQQLVTLMDGNIWLESEVGKGSDFHLVVPFKLLDDELSNPTGKPKDPQKRETRPIQTKSKLLMRTNDHQTMPTNYSRFIKDAIPNIEKLDSAILARDSVLAETQAKWFLHAAEETNLDSLKNAAFKLMLSVRKRDFESANTLYINIIKQMLKTCIFTLE